MAEDRGVLREIAWREVFPWLGLVRCVRLALAPRLLFLAALGLVATSVGWRMIGRIYSDSDDLQKLGWIAADSDWPWRAQLASVPSLSFNGLDPSVSPVLQTGQWLTAPFRRMFLAPSPDAVVGIVPFTYTLICGLWELAVWALIGGAITRIAALALARESRVSLTDGLRFGTVKWLQYFLAALFPLLGVIVLSLVAGVVFGLIMRADFGFLVMSFFWPLMLLAGLVMAILLLCLVFGWALMWPTVSVEGTDSFDALSRSYSYTFQRPFHYLFYAIVAGVLGLLAAHVVIYFVEWTNWLALWSASWGSGAARAKEIGNFLGPAPLPADTPWSVSAGAKVLNFWIDCVLLVGAGYLYSFLWTAATAVYYLLRQSVDGTEPDEVAVEREEETFSLPPLKSDESGVPQVADPKPGGA